MGGILETESHLADRLAVDAKDREKMTRLESEALLDGMDAIAIGFCK